MVVNRLRRWQVFRALGIKGHTLLVLVFIFDHDLALLDIIVFDLDLDLDFVFAGFLKRFSVGTRGERIGFDGCRVAERAVVDKTRKLKAERKPWCFLDLFIQQLDDPLDLFHCSVEAWEVLPPLDVLTISSELGQY